MEILSTKVEWQFGHKNSPKLKVLVNKIPSQEDLRYKEIPVAGGLLYLAEKDGYVTFFVSTSDKRGYTGRTFHIELLSGEKRSIKGPWSSRAGVANRYLEKPCIGCVLTDDKETFQRGYTFYSAHLLVDLVKAYAETAYPHWELKEEIHFDNEIYWVPRLKERYHKNYLQSLGIVMPKLESFG